MGIQPSELIDLTPYELNLLKEGFQKKLEDDMLRSKFVAYITYASITASVGGTPVPYEEWDQPSAPEPKEPVDSKKLKAARRISAKYKREQEERMNNYKE